MKIKKHSDGNYYEKIVTWKEKPEYGNIIMIIIFSSALIYSIIMVGIEEPVSLAVSLASTFFGFCLLGILIGLFKSLGKGRKVKYRRIGR